MNDNLKISPGNQMHDFEFLSENRRISEVGQDVLISNGIPPQTAQEINLDANRFYQEADRGEKHFFGFPQGEIESRKNLTTKETPLLYGPEQNKKILLDFDYNDQAFCASKSNKKETDQMNPGPSRAGLNNSYCAYQPQPQPSLVYNSSK